MSLSSPTKKQHSAPVVSFHPSSDGGSLPSVSWSLISTKSKQVKKKKSFSACPLPLIQVLELPVDLFFSKFRVICPLLERSRSHPIYLLTTLPMQGGHPRLPKYAACWDGLCGNQGCRCRDSRMMGTRRGSLESRESWLSVLSTTLESFCFSHSYPSKSLL